MDLELRSWHEDDLDWLVGLLTSWDPRDSADSIRTRMAAGGATRTRHVACLDGVAVGYASHRLPSADETVSVALVLVDPASRGRGVGGRLFRAVSQDFGMHRVLCVVPDHDETSFAVARAWGFEATLHTGVRRLDLGARPPEPQPRGGIAVRVVADRDLAAADLDPEPLLRASGTNPEAADGLPFALDYVRQSNPAFVWVVAEEAGAPVACCLIDVEDTDVAEVLFTGVAPTARRRGLGRLVKEHAHAAAYARGARSLVTDNDERNLAVVALNESMGYRRTGGEWSMVRPPAPS
jgi:GNAT superfamily N-acetyltransferase